ncbi:alpha-hydroxy acid oxidase [Albimonas pacifica]|uniref:L-lactate dehydrogenase (Cytochrome) n=1 Tax=Albimonas pacifica TaxID=1114924 RepID=A0A1I3G9P8_9RHOB|nr:alpha-hydroxy acid oxidase [Albimonas pacifica]SFI20228.1 L-lactate dehydrogenase (cytochrome) [Albimonas pacifica]
MANLEKLVSMEDLRRRARRRMPRVAWEFLDSGTGAETALKRNRERMDAVTMVPRMMRAARTPDTSAPLLGRTWTAPIGVAPVGLQSLMWPGIEKALAAMAAERGIPYCLSTVAGESLEDIARVNPDFWFQLYAPTQEAARKDLIRRAHDAGAKALVLTVDIPRSSRRERQRRAGVGMPPKTTPRLIADVLSRPSWALATWRRGVPTMRTLAPYVPAGDMKTMAEFTAKNLGHDLTPEAVAEIRDLWPGTFIVKGVLHPEDAEKMVEIGVDAVWVSNHGGRQVDIGCAAIDALPGIVAAVGERTEIIFDSGIASGADVARAVALGAKMCFLGRGFVWGVAALGAPGAGHAEFILRDELSNVMSQLGCHRLDELKERLA